ncbi:flagellar motor switch protein FliM [Kaarinaea lacus]
MSVNDLLTQEEIDALLSGQSSDDIIFSDSDEALEESSAEAGTEDWGDNDQIPALGLLNRRYAQLFKMVFFNLLRKDVNVRVSGINLLPLADYVDGLYVPSSINSVQLNPLEGSALFVLDPDLVNLLIENYFGGGGSRLTRQKKQDFTPLENRVIELLLEKMFVVLRKAWEPVMPLEFELVNSVVNTQFTGVDKPEESVVVSSFSVEIISDSGVSQKGELQITMSYPLLEDILGTDV